jgi:hypothetical protein
MKFINENVYIRLLHVFLGLSPDMILTIFCCKVNTILLQNELPLEIIPYFIIQRKAAK